MRDKAAERSSFYSVKYTTKTFHGLLHSVTHRRRSLVLLVLKYFDISNAISDSQSQLQTIYNILVLMQKCTKIYKTGPGNQTCLKVYIAIPDSL